jgi:hypothetical protein
MTPHKQPHGHEPHDSAKGNAAARKAGKSTTRRAEDIAEAGPEPGHHPAGAKGRSGRPASKSSARASTGVDPREPIDPRSPTPKRGGG